MKNRRKCFNHRSEIYEKERQLAVITGKENLSDDDDDVVWPEVDISFVYVYLIGLRLYSIGNIKSAPAKHSHDNQQPIDWCSATILTVAQSRQQLNLLEHAAITCYSLR